MPMSKVQLPVFEARDPGFKYKPMDTPNLCYLICITSTCNSSPC